MHPQGYMLHVSQTSFKLNSKIYRHFQKVRQVNSDIGTDVFFSLNCKVNVKYCFTGDLLQQFLLKQHFACFMFSQKGKIEREEKKTHREIRYYL